MTHIELRPQGPHDDAYTARLAEAFAETVRVLNYATRPGSDGLGDPATVHTVLGSLAAGTHRMLQLLEQLGTYLDDERRARRLASDESISMSWAVDEVGGHMAEARIKTVALTWALEQAHNAARTLYRPEGTGR